MVWAIARPDSTLTLNSMIGNVFFGIRKMLWWTAFIPVNQSLLFLFQRMVIKRNF